MKRRGLESRESGFWQSNALVSATERWNCGNSIKQSLSPWTQSKLVGITGARAPIWSRAESKNGQHKLNKNSVWVIFQSCYIVVGHNSTVVLNVDEEHVVYMFEKKVDECVYLCFYVSAYSLCQHPCVHTCRLWCVCFRNGIHTNLWVPEDLFWNTSKWLENRMYLKHQILVPSNISKAGLKQSCIWRVECSL